MIIRNTFKIHPFYYFFVFVSVITGHFKNFLLFSLLIFIHEIGHLFMAILLGWKVEKVLILPFGGVTVFNEDLNRPLIEEFLILIFGPLFQLIFVIVFRDNMLINYSNNLLLFNMLPIIPLDGSKFLNIFSNLFFSFKKSHLLTIYISFLSIFFVLKLFDFSLFLIFIFIFLIFKVIDEFMSHNNIFNRFLLERYIKNFNFNRYTIIKSLDFRKMKRDNKHIFCINGRQFTEKYLLKKRFDFTFKSW